MGLGNVDTDGNICKNSGREFVRESMKGDHFERETVRLILFLLGEEYILLGFILDLNE